MKLLSKISPHLFVFSIPEDSTGHKISQDKSGWSKLYYIDSLTNQKVINIIGTGKYEIIGTLLDILSNKNLADRTFYKSKVQEKQYYHQDKAVLCDDTIAAFRYRLQLEDINMSDINQLFILVVDNVITSQREKPKLMSYRGYREKKTRGWK